MDSLDSLPENPSHQPTPQEEAVMNRYFGPTGKTQAGGGKGRSALKMTGYVTILYLLLSNPWVDDLLSRMPYCGHPLLRMAAKTLLFAILFLIVYKFC